MTLLYTAPKFLEHDTGLHPEAAVRLKHVVGMLESLGVADRCARPHWEPANRGTILSVHDEVVVDNVEKLVARGGGHIDADTVVTPASMDVAHMAVGAVCDATRRVLTGKDIRAFCAVRPPGHHACSDQSMGFCLFNNIALAAQTALDAGVERLLIVDWDVHHGNGTQQIFYAEPRVGFFSVHRSPFYPGTGSADETGTGKGLGTTCNLPLEFGISRQKFREEVQRELEAFATRIKPELVLVSAGFDAHREDPIGSLGLEVEDFAWLTTLCVEIANDYSLGRVVSTLEGGYNPPVLAECVAVHLTVLGQ